MIFFTKRLKNLLDQYGIAIDTKSEIVWARLLDESNTVAFFTKRTMTHKVITTPNRLKYAQRMNLGRFFAKHTTATPEITKHIVEVFKGRVLSGELEFSESKIGNAYDTTKFSSRVTPNTTLAKSCMNNDFSYLRLYSKLDCVSIVGRLAGETGIVVRATLWNNVQFSVEESKEYFVAPLLDRVYSCSDVATKAMLEYAKANGWIYKKYNNYSSPRKFIKNGKELTCNASIKIDHTNIEWGGIPYFDTFKYLGANVLRNYPKPFDRYSFTRSKGGYYEYCPQCGRVYRPEDGSRLLVDPKFGTYCTECGMFSVMTGKKHSPKTIRMDVVSRFSHGISWVPIGTQLPSIKKEGDRYYFLPHMIGEVEFSNINIEFKLAHEGGEI